MLDKIKKGLLWLADKLGAALPGILGSLLYSIFKTTPKAVDFVSKEMWILLVAVVAFIIKCVYDS